MSNAVSIRGLSKKFNRFLALDDVSFDIPANSVFGLLGPNGAGKTTLFSIAAGFIKATSGSISVLGIDVKNISQLRGRLSMLPQDSQFQGGIPVIDQLVMFSRLSGYDKTAARKAAEDALEIVGLSEVAKRNARALSHGMMKRVILCQAFIGNPEVIFLDEPTAGLDPDNARRIRELVKQYSKSRTVILSSHNLQEIQDICSHVCILDHGKVAQVGTMDSLTNASHLVRVTPNKPLTPEAKNALLAISYVSLVEQSAEADSTDFNIRLGLTSIDEKEDAMKQIYEALSAHGIYPTSIHQGPASRRGFSKLPEAPTTGPQALRKPSHGLDRDSLF